MRVMLTATENSTNVTHDVMRQQPIDFNEIKKKKLSIVMYITQYTCYINDVVYAIYNLNK